MKYRYFASFALAGVFAGAHLSAQTSIPATANRNRTSGMIGVAPNQTVRLNVLSLNPNTGTPIMCSVALQFVDVQNRVLKQQTVANIPPGQAVALDVRREDIAAATPTRLEIRSIVLDPAVPPPASAGEPNIPAGPPCRVAANVEVFDDTIGATLALVGVAHRLAPSPIPVPAGN